MHVVVMQAVARVRDVGVRARSEAREAYQAYRTAYDLARHYRDEVVPLRKFINDEVLLRYKIGGLILVPTRSPGATLDLLARRYYGREDLWWRIADANPARFPLDWKAGDRLLVPPLRIATRTPRSTCLSPPGPGSGRTLRPTRCWRPTRRWMISAAAPLPGRRCWR